jgi:hypothetical protein
MQLKIKTPCFLIILIYRTASCISCCYASKGEEMSIRQSWTSLAGVGVSVIASLMAATVLFTTEKISSIKIGDLAIEAVQPKLIGGTPTEITDEISAIKLQQEALSKLPADVPVSSKIEQIELKINAIAKDVEVINKAIMASPEKALKIPLLRRDFTALQQKYENATKALEKDIEQAYDTMRSVIGTIVVGILGIAASVVM